MMLNTNPKVRKLATTGGLVMLARTPRGYAQINRRFPDTEAGRADALDITARYLAQQWVVWLGPEELACQLRRTMSMTAHDEAAAAVDAALAG